MLILKRKRLPGADRFHRGERGTPSTNIYARWGSRWTWVPRSYAPYKFVIPIVFGTNNPLNYVLVKVPILIVFWNQYYVEDVFNVFPAEAAWILFGIISI